MEYMGEFSILEWTGEFFIQIPTGLKETGLQADNMMEILRETITAKEIDQLNDMESLSSSFPLKKKTAKEVMTKIAKDAADEGMSFLVDTLIETTLDIDMGTDRKPSIFGELFKMAMDEEERSYIASIGKYEKDQLFFESVVPTSEKIQPFFKTEYEADFFVAHVALNTYETTHTFVLEDLEEAFIKEYDKIEEQDEMTFNYQGIHYKLEYLDAKTFSYNPFTMAIDLAEKKEEMC